MRAILNFGHTFGHSVETLNNFKLLHGECVAIGMVAALYYSMECGNTTKEDIENIEKLLEFLNFLLDVITMLMKFIIRCFMIKRLQVAK